MNADNPGSRSELKRFLSIEILISFTHHVTTALHEVVRYTRRKKPGYLVGV